MSTMDCPVCGKSLGRYVVYVHGACIAEMREHRAQREGMGELREALGVVLDNVDYTAGNCRGIDMVSAVLPKEAIAKARAALAASGPAGGKGESNENA